MENMNMGISDDEMTDVSMAQYAPEMEVTMKLPTDGFPRERKIVEMGGEDNLPADGKPREEFLRDVTGPKINFPTDEESRVENMVHGEISEFIFPTNEETREEKLCEAEIVEMNLPTDGNWREAKLVDGAVSEIIFHTDEVTRVNGSYVHAEQEKISLSEDVSREGKFGDELQSAEFSPDADPRGEKL